MKNTLKILILEDNPADAGLTLRALRKSDLQFEHLIADNKESYVEGLKNFQPDVILSDHSLPAFTSEEALPLAKELCSNSVFILVTGTVSEEFAVNILKAGADDYLLKSSLTRLSTAILNAYTKKQAEIERAENMQKLSEVNQELKTFIYRASHDIRGPLSSMKGLINIARIETEPEAISKLIRLMESSAEKMDKIVVDLIETLGVRERNPVPERVDVNKMIHEIISMYSDLVKAKKLKFFVEGSVENEFVSDARILRAILHRVIDNAVKFHNYSLPGAYVSIGFKTEDQGISISIADNGIGINEEYIKRIFEMFFRANGESEGSGLGLYLVKIGTEKLGGKIDIKSTEQLGTTAVIKLPSL